MSGSEDQPPPTRRGRLPRSNLPRPSHARRPAERDRAEQASPDRGTGSPTEASAEEASADSTADAPSSGAAAPSGAEIDPASIRPTEPASANEAAPGVTAPDIADKQTAKVRGSEELKRATLVRVDAEGTDAAVAANAYVGCVIDGRYRVDAVIGRGGMGVVYRGRHEVIDKLVAIKILLPTEDLDVVARFVNEARAATSIGNPHIVDTIDFGRLPDQSTYFAMEYLEGETLAGIIKTSGFLALHRAIHIAKQVAEGMAAAHAANIVHRDLKPENVFITKHGKEDDFVKLLDFGIAKVASAQQRLTRAGTIFGTPHYMSPEQAAGAEVDHRSDIYSLGVMLYEMSSGRTPFEAENTMGLLTQHMYSQPSPLTDLRDLPQVIPVQLDAIVLKCLSKRPEDRYASMREVIDDLERVEHGKSPSALADLLERKDDDDLAAVRAAAKAASRRSPRIPIWVVAAGAVLAGGAAVLALRSAPFTRSLPTAIDSSGQPIPEPSAPAAKDVFLFYSPKDAEVLNGSQPLSGRPVTIRVEPGKPATIRIRRHGFYPETVIIDGSQRALVVELQEMPGVVPSVPVPEDPEFEALKKEHALDMSRMLSDAGVARLLSRDAGTRRRKKPPDAGTKRPRKTEKPVAAPPELQPASSAGPVQDPPPLDLSKQPLRKPRPADDER